MRQRIVFVLMFVLMFLLVLQPALVSADTIAPLKDFAQYSADRRLVFVMLVREQDPTTNHEVHIVEQDEALRQKYAQSGLYHIDDATHPLWTVEWNARAVELASDGHHLVRWGPWPVSDDYQELALAFYRDGKEIQRYQVNDLVAHPDQLPKSVSHYRWHDTSNFDEPAMILTLDTLNQEHYRFDVRSGQLIEGTLPNQRQSLWLWGSAAILLIGVILAVYRRKARL